jgi:hypothetical protein
MKKAEALATHAAAYRIQAEAAALCGSQDMVQHYLQLAIEYDALASSYRSMAAKA